ncbi:MAG TPA: 30S ribosomal protein S9 [Pirellulales bacterium]|nr:30S ribosomal protein S9 [Pirellulales bacterium]
MVASKEAPAKAAKVSGANDSLGTGRRKTSVARVRVRAGSGTITINGRPLDDYFPVEQDRRQVLSPLALTGRSANVDVVIRVIGGGPSGQSGACKLGIARALKLFDAGTEEALRQHHLLTRDSRMKERKKYGLRGARRGTQFSKR